MRAIGRRELLVGACCLAVGLALQGCREEEQDRVLYFDKGTYSGVPDRPLTEEQLRALRHRATQQGA